MADNKKAFIKFLSLFVLAAALIFYFFNQPIRAAERDAETAQQACTELANKEHCYAKFFAVLTKNINMGHAFKTLKKLQALEPEARGCHFIAHAISSAEAEKTPGKWKEIMNAAPQDCSYGAVHGALEFYAATFPNGQIPESQIGELCPNPDINNCSHGLGHVLLVMNKNDINKSLSQCEALPHNETAQFECLTGVFMERVTAVNLKIHGFGLPTKLPELEKLCFEQASTSSTACWKEIVHAAVTETGNNMQEVATFCERAPQEKAVGECLNHSFGIIAAAHNFDLYKAAPVCDVKATAPDFKFRCFHHLVSAVLSTVPQELKTAKIFCSSLETPYGTRCLKTVEGFESALNSNIPGKTSGENHL